MFKWQKSSSNPWAFADATHGCFFKYPIQPTYALFNQNTQVVDKNDLYNKKASRTDALY